MASGGRASEREAKGRRGKGAIPLEIREQARKVESPVVSELLVAARKGYTDQVVRILQEDPDKGKTTDKYGHTCLHLACSHDHLPTALAILQSGAVGINTQSKRGLTPLHEACQEGHSSLSLLLLSLGADLNIRTTDGWSPLMSACCHGNVQLAHILVAAGSNVEALTKLGLTPLHIAAWKGHTPVVQMLLRVGCNPATVAHNNKTALQLAELGDHHETVTILQAATAKNSIDPFYRISSLEGQLRAAQKRLIDTQSEQEEVWKVERRRGEERREELIRAHSQEVEVARRRINELEAVLGRTEGSGGGGCGEESSSGGGDGKNGGKSGGGTERSSQSSKRGRERGGERVAGDRANHSSPQQALVSSDLRNKSASCDDLVHPKRHSSPSALTRHPPPPHTCSKNEERSTITQMVAECLHNPASIANIRSELKADGLTPKINRKFHPKATPTSLPAMSVETSPLARDSRRAGELWSQRSSPGEQLQKSSPREQRLQGTLVWSSKTTPTAE